MTGNQLSLFYNACARPTEPLPASFPDWSQPRASKVPRAPDSQVRRLPVLIEGRGSRKDDCERVGECLKRFLSVRANFNAKTAHCPTVCPSYEPQEPHVRHAIATWQRESR